MAIKKQAPITIDVSLDENKIPENISWSAPDGGVINQDAKAMLLTFWESDFGNTIRRQNRTRHLVKQHSLTFFK